jgi:hypothetical protein
LIARTVRFALDRGVGSGRSHEPDPRPPRRIITVQQSRKLGARNPAGALSTTHALGLLEQVSRTS